MVYAWQTAEWYRLLAGLDRLPHALLLTGAAGSGTPDFATELARRLLCESAQGVATACGECVACNWFSAGNHPDFRRVAPGSDEGEDEDAEDDAADKSKRPTQIRIEQIRALAQFLSVGALRQGRRVVLIDPAGAMNHHTANALLKLLEEPPISTNFILVSDNYRRLLPTILSRCRILSFARPERPLALAWLEQQAVADAGNQLAFAGGMPVAAAELAESIGVAARDRFVRELLSLECADPLALAAGWENWLRSKEAIAAGFGVPQLVVWMQRWIADLASTAAAGRARFFPGEVEALSRLSRRLPITAVLACYNELIPLRRVANHPLNLRLFLDDMLLRYARLLARASA